MSESIKNPNIEQSNTKESIKNEKLLWVINKLKKLIKDPDIEKVEKTWYEENLNSVEKLINIKWEVDAEKILNLAISAKDAPNDFFLKKENQVLLIIIQDKNKLLEIIKLFNEKWEKVNSNNLNINIKYDIDILKSEWLDISYPDVKNIKLDVFKKELKKFDYSIFKNISPRLIDWIILDLYKDWVDKKYLEDLAKFRLSSERKDWRDSWINPFIKIHILEENIEESIKNISFSSIEKKLKTEEEINNNDVDFLVYNLKNKNSKEYQKSISLIVQIINTNKKFPKSLWNLAIENKEYNGLVEKRNNELENKIKNFKGFKETLNMTWENNNDPEMFINEITSSYFDKIDTNNPEYFLELIQFTFEKSWVINSKWEITNQILFDKYFQTIIVDDLLDVKKYMYLVAINQDKIAKRYNQLFKNLTPNLVKHTQKLQTEYKERKIIEQKEEEKQEKDKTKEDKNISINNNIFSENYDIKTWKLYIWNNKSIDLTPEEKRLVEEWKENLIIDTYKAFNDLWLDSLWNRRTEIFKWIKNVYNEKFNYTDSNYIWEQELKIILNSILISVWLWDRVLALSEPITNFTNNFRLVNKVDSRNNANENIMWETSIENLFKKKFYPEWSSMFKLESFIKSIK